ncbi:hypothetical protein Bbelb_350270 [Branchiostoma belcheri]|nr:hypothetical protein Bbelb_350270 [Branchiostoma belcheri]
MGKDICFHAGGLDEMGSVFFLYNTPDAQQAGTPKKSSQEAGKFIRGEDTMLRDRSLDGLRDKDLQRQLRQYLRSASEANPPKFPDVDGFVKKNSVTLRKLPAIDGKLVLARVEVDERRSAKYNAVLGNMLQYLKRELDILLLVEDLLQEDVI